MDKEYDEMNFEDLFNELTEEKKVDEEVAKEVDAIHSMKTTLTNSRISSVESQKAS